MVQSMNPGDMWWKFTSGSASRRRTSGGSASLWYSQAIATAPMTNWPSSLILPGRPFLFLRDSFR